MLGLVEGAFFADVCSARGLSASGFYTHLYQVSRLLVEEAAFIGQNDRGQSTRLPGG